MKPVNDHVGRYKIELTAIDRSGETTSTIFDLVVSMNQLVNVIMSPCLPSECASLVRVHVIRFLDCYKKFQEYKCKPNGIPSWLSKMNFL